MGTSSSQTGGPIRAAAVALATAAVTLVSASPALASTHGPVKFKVSGIVTAVHGTRLTVLARTARVGRHTARNREVTVDVAGHARHGSARRMAARLATGDAVNASGTERDGSLEATNVAAAPRPAEVLIGVIDTIAGNLVTLTSRDRADGGSTQHDGDGRDRPTVDVSAATFSGAASASGDLVPGMTIVVLGEEWHDTMAAARVYSFAIAPALAVGRVSAADATAKSLTVDTSGEDGDQQGDDGDQQGTTSAEGSSTSGGSDASSTDPAGSGTSTDGSSANRSSDSAQTSPASAINVDASGADIVANGNDGQQAVTFPAAGDKVLVVGSAGSTTNTITATLVFAFDGHDRGCVGHNED